MPDVIAPQFARFIAAERRAGRLSVTRRPMAAGEPLDRVVVDAKRASELLRVVAKRMVGLFHPTKRREVVWVDGDRELAISIADLQMNVTDGLIQILIPVRCDQTGKTTVKVVFAVGSQKQPSGLYASTYRRPIGPAVIVDAWGDALVAFAWQCVLGLTTGIAGATGKDNRGNVLIPIELTASRGAVEITPMVRHRFAGSSGLQATSKTR